MCAKRNLLTRLPTQGVTASCSKMDLDFNATQSGVMMTHRGLTQFISNQFGGREMKVPRPFSIAGVSNITSRQRQPAGVLWPIKA
jgi:hypothetical protein